MAIIHLAEYDPDEIFPLVTLNKTKREFVVNGEIYLVKMSSHRYHTFKKSRKCVCCGIEGTKLILDKPPLAHSPHFNFYTKDNILMTKDHILPKSLGGKNCLDNYQTMCCICNELKQHYILDMSDLLQLRQILDDPDMTRKDKRTLIEATRKEMCQHDNNA